MTLPEAVTEANDDGWYIYSLSQEESLNDWHCTLRCLTGGPRRQIAHGRGDSPDTAIYHALGAAFELEAEVSISTLPVPDRPRVSIHALGASLGLAPIQPPRRPK